MARVRAWWTQRRYDQTIDATFTRDLLFGSGLAEPGATVLRLIGRLEWNWTQSSASNQPMLVFGLLVTDLPDTALLTADTATDWLYWTELLAGEGRGAVGATVGTAGWWQTNAWDVEGRRTLELGESVWLLGRLFNRDGLEPVDRLTVSRTLVLRPDV